MGIRGDGEMLDWMEQLPDPKVQNTRKRKNRRYPSNHRESKIGVHTTVNGKGAIARLRKEKRK